jgi:putative redox protein
MWEVLAMQIRYLDGHKFEIEERGIKVITDQPRPAGNNEGLTPPEFLNASLGSCIGVYVADYLKRNDLSPEGLVIDVASQHASNPNRISGFVVEVQVPIALTDRQRASLSRIVKACKVHNTLTHPPEMQIELVES